MSERIDVTILGRALGTASGWDGDPGKWICFYDFEPKAGIDLPPGDLNFNELKGLIGPASETGEMEDGKDIVLFLYDIARED